MSEVSQLIGKSQLTRNCIHSLECRWRIWVSRQRVCLVVQRRRMQSKRQKLSRRFRWNGQKINIWLFRTLFALAEWALLGIAQQFHFSFTTSYRLSSASLLFFGHKYFSLFFVISSSLLTVASLTLRALKLHKNILLILNLRLVMLFPIIAQMRKIIHFQAHLVCRLITLTSNFIFINFVFFNEKKSEIFEKKNFNGQFTRVVRE